MSESDIQASIKMMSLAINRFFYKNYVQKLLVNEFTSLYK